MSEHPLIVTLRNRRKELRLSRSQVRLSSGMSPGAFHRREGTGRFGALEQFERWAGFLGYKLTLTAIEAEPEIWS